MIPSLARMKFIDRKWTAVNLDDLTQYWSRLCRFAEEVRHVALKPEYALELRIRGFPRSACQTLHNSLNHRYSALGLTVTAADPDTLVLSWSSIDSGDAPPAGLGLSLLTGELFNGLALEIRLCFSDIRGPLKSTTERGFTLVLSGRLLENKLVVKSLWGGRATESENGIYNTPTPWEKHLLTGFDRFRETGEIAGWLLDSVYFPKEPPTLQRFVSRVVDVPFGRPRLRGLLVRCTASAAWLGVIAAGICFAPLNQEILGYIVCILGIVWLFFFGTFSSHEFHLLFNFYSAQRAQKAAEYQQSMWYTQLTSEQTAARLDDPVVLKWTAEVIEAGFVFVGDAASVPIEQAENTYRIFHAPDKTTYLVLCCCWTRSDSNNASFQYWPTIVSFECQTFFSDGGRVDSIDHNSHPNYASDPHLSTRTLAFPQAKDPFALFRLHTAAVDAVAGEMAATPIRHEPFDRYLRRQEQISEEDCHGYAKRPYSFRDHLRWYLQLDAKSSVESK